MAFRIFGLYAVWRKRGSASHGNLSFEEEFLRSQFRLPPGTWRVPRRSIKLTMRSSSTFAARKPARSR